MNSDLYFDGKKYISARKAGTLSGYSTDYIGQLCRTKKVVCQRVGKVWYIAEDSLVAYIAEVAALSNQKKHLKTLEKNISVPKNFSKKLGHKNENISGYVKQGLDKIQKQFYVHYPKILSYLSTSNRNQQSAISDILIKRVLTGTFVFLLSFSIAQANVPLFRFSEKVLKETIDAPKNAYTALNEFSDFYGNTLVKKYVSLGNFIITGAPEARVAIAKCVDQGIGCANAINPISLQGRSLGLNFEKKSWVYGTALVGQTQNFVYTGVAEIPTVKNTTYAQVAAVQASSNNSIDGAGLGIYGSIHGFLSLFAPQTVQVKTFDTVVQSASAARQTIQKAQNTQPVVREIITQTVAAPKSSVQIIQQQGISEAELNAKLEQLSDSVNSRFAALSTGIGGSVTNVYNEIAGSQIGNLSNLSGTAISNPTITGGSISGTSISTGGLEADNASLGTTTIAQLTIGTTTPGCAQFSANGLLFSTGTACGTGVGGGGSGGGTFSTTTSFVAGEFVNYSNNATDIVTIGGNSTTTAPFYFDPNTLVAYFGGNVGIGTTSPYAPLSVVGQVVAANFTATTTATSTLPTLLTTNATTTNLAVTAVTSSLLKTDASGNVIPAQAGVDYQAAGNYATFGYPFPNNATSTTLTFNTGLLSVGSTTIVGNATTTGTLGASAIFLNASQYFTSLLGSGLKNVNGALTLDTSANNNWSGANVFQNASTTFVGNVNLGNVSQGFLFAGSNGTIGSIASSSIKLSWFTNDAGYLTAATGLTSYDAFTHPSYGGSATTSLFTLSNGFLSTASSTVVGQFEVAGNVGIGTSSPAQSLDVYGNEALGVATPSAGSSFLNIRYGASNFSQGYIKFTSNTTDEWALANNLTSTNNYFALYDYNSSQDRIEAYQGNGAPLLLQPAFGNVGVGPTSTPTARLTVEGSSNQTTDLFNVASSTNASYVDVKSNGNVGIGTTSPTTNLEVAMNDTHLSGIQITGPSASYRPAVSYSALGTNWATGLLLGDGSTFSIRSGTTVGTNNGTDRLTINSSGLVGIGTTSPFRTLSVGGSGIFTGGDVTASTFTATSSISAPSLTLSGVAINSLLSTNSSGQVVATSTPTFGAFNATSTTATSTIAGGFAVQGSKFIVDRSTGNVGIGTTTPPYALTVQKNGDFQLQLANFSSGGGSWNIGQSDGSFGAGGGSLLFVPDNKNSTNAVLTLKNSGNVGIGTTSPESLLNLYGGALDITPTSQNSYNEGIRLHPATDDYSTIALGAVAGNSGTGAGQWSIIRYPSTTYNNQFGIRYNASDYLDISSTGGASFPSGGLGVGTSTPSLTKLEVLSTANGFGQVQVANTSSNGEASIGFISGITGFGNTPTSVNGDANVWAIGAGIFSGSGSTFGIGNKSYNGSIFNLTSSGNVGIGTTTPAAALHVVSSNQEVARFDRSSGSGSTGITIYQAGLQKGSLGTGDFVVSGGSNSDFGIQSAGNLVFGVGGATERMRLTSAGNIGIGSTTPNNRLDVNGNSYVSGTAFIGGAITATSTLSLTNLGQGFVYSGSNGTLNSIASSSVKLSWFNNDAGFTNYSYPFPSAATSTALTFNGGITLGNTAVNSILSTNGSGAVVATSTPTFGVFNATSTSATSTIAGGLAVNSVSATIASTTNLVVSNAAGASTYCLQIDSTGKVSNTGAACGTGSGSVNSVSNSDHTLTISPTTGAVVASLNLANANTWTATQTFTYSSTTNYASFVTASTTNLIVNGSSFNNFLGSGLTNSGGALTVSGLTTTNFASANISQFTNDAGYITSALQSYDAFTHPAAGKSATTSEVWVGGLLSTASTTIVGNATTTGTQYVGSQLSVNGNVGIGTSSPSQLLTVGNNNQFTVTSAGAVAAAGLISANAGINIASGYTENFLGTGYIDWQSGNLNFRPGSTVKSYIDANGTYNTQGQIISTGVGTNSFLGNLGIGTTSPYAPLSVVGQIVAAYYNATTTATSTFPTLLSTRATTSALAITGITSSLLKTDANGNVLPAVAGTDYQAAGNYLTAYDAFTHPATGKSATTSELWTAGLLSTASSTFSSSLYLSSLNQGFAYLGSNGLIQTIATSSLNLPNAALQHSSFTLNGTTINLGDTQTITAASSTLLGDANTFSGATKFTNTVALTGAAVNSLLSTDNSGNIVATSTPTFGAFNATSTTATSTIAGALAVGGSKLVVLQNGNVGIGTTTPNKELTVYNGVANQMTGITDSGIYFSRTSDGGYQESIVNDALNQNLTLNSRNQITFISNSITAGAFNDNNSVGLLTVNAGANTQSGNPNLGVNGNAAIGSSYYSLTSGLPTNGLAVQGNVGIGTTSPYANLAVVGDIVSTRNVNTANLTATGTVTYSGLSQGFNYTGSNGIQNTIASSSIKLSWFNNDAGFTTYAFPFTVNTGYNSTSTVLGLNGFFSTASSTISGSFNLPALSNGGLAVYGGAVSSGATTTAGTGLTYSGNAFNVNTTQNIAKLSNLSTNGFVKTINGDGTLSVDTTSYQPAGTYLTALGSGYASTTNTSVTFSTSTLSFNGLTLGQTIVPTAGALTVTPTVTGTLNNAGLTHSTIVVNGTTLTLGDTNDTITAASSTLLGDANTFSGATKFTNTLNLSAAAINSLLSTDASGNVVATSTPTFGAFNATSTTATSTIAGGLAVGGSKLVVLQNGNVGIGTAVPGAPLDVNGNIYSETGGSVFTDTLRSYGSSGITINGGTGASSKFIVSTGNAERLHIDNNGLVGIGSTTPYANLSVFTGGDYAAHAASTVFAIGSSTAGTATSTLLSVLSNGNVGVGTSSPLTKLHITGSANTINGVGTTVLIDTGGVTDNAVLQLNSGNARDAGVTFSDNGTKEWDIRNVGSSNPTNRLAFVGTGSNEWMTLTNNGNLGIGTTSPYANLAVVGDIVSTRNVNTANLTATGTVTYSGLSQGFNYTGSNGIQNTIASSSIKLSWFNNDAGFFSSYDAFTHPASGKSATTSELWTNGLLSQASSTFVSSLFLPSLTQGFAYLGSNGLIQTVATSSLNLPNAALQHSTIVLNGSTLTLGDTNDTIIAASSTLLGDANTFSGANKFTNALTYFAGSVGVGTTSPNWKLTVASTTQPQLALEGNDADNIWTLRSIGGSLYFATSSPTTFATSSLSALSINSNGYIGIATTAPAHNFVVQGDMQLTGAFYDASSSAGSSGYVLQSTGNGTEWVATTTLGLGAGATQWLDSGSTIYYNGGQVGIGTASTNARLDVLAAPTDNAALILDTGASSNPWDIQFNQSGLSSAAVALISNLTLGWQASLVPIADNSSVYTLGNGSNRWYSLAVGTGASSFGGNVSVAGNLGVGTTSPSQAISVAGNVLADTFNGSGNATTLLTQAGQPIINATVSGTAAVSVGLYNSVSGDHNSAFGINNNASGATYSSAFGVGNTASGYLSSAFGSQNTVSNNTSMAFGASNNVSGTQSAAFGYNITNAIDHTVMIGPSNTAKVTIDSNGNLGIGTTSPSANLAVQVGGDYAAHAAGTAFIIASSSAGSATSTLFSVLSNGAVYIPSLSQGFNYTGSNGIQNTIASSSIKLSWFNNDAGFFSSYDAFTHPATGKSATTSEVWTAGLLSTASSTFSSSLYLSSLNQGFAYLGTNGLIQTVATSSLNLPNAALQHSSFTLNGTTINLGDTQTITAASSTLLGDANTFSKLQTFAYSSTTNYASFATASTTNLIINGQSFNNLLGSGLTNSGGALTVSNVPLTSLAALAANSIVTTNASGNLIATGTQLTVGNILSTTTATSTFVGAVGIGTTTPFATFAVNPTAGFAANQFVVGSSTATALLVSNAGWVGIGTTSPTAHLAISSTQGNGYSLNLTQTGGNASQFLTINNGATNLLKFTADSNGNPTLSIGDGNGTNRILISASTSSFFNGGSVVIGKASGALATLDVNATNTASTIVPILRLAGIDSGVASAAGGGLGIAFQDVNGNRNLRDIAAIQTSWSNATQGSEQAGLDLFAATANSTSATTLTDVMHLSGNGNVGIGTTTPYANLAVVLGADYASHAAGTAFIIASSSAGSATSTLLSVLSNGNVGIGTNNPTAALQVNGGLLAQASSTFVSSLFLPSLSQGFNYTGSNGLIQTVATSSLNLPNAALQHSTIILNGTTLTLGDAADTITAASSTLLTDNNTFTKNQTFAYSSTTNYASFATASTTNLIVNGSSFNKLLGSGLINSGGALTVSGLTTSNFASANISQFTNDAGYLTSATGLTAYDAFTHPASGKSATTSEIWTNGLLSQASSTFVSSLFLPSLTQGFAYLGTNGLIQTIATSSLNLPNAALQHSTIILNGTTLTLGDAADTITAASSTLLANSNTFSGVNKFTNTVNLSAAAINSLLSTDASGNVVATSTPTFGAFNATSTTATSTIAGGLAVGSNALNVLQNGNIGIGTTTPDALLAIAGGANKELVTNGTFTGNATGWTLGTGWAYTSDTVEHTPGQTAALKQTTVPIVKGKTYTYSFDVSMSQGEVCLEIGTISSNANLLAVVSSNGTYTPSNGVFTAQASGDLEFDPTCGGDDAGGTFDGGIDNVSFQEVSSALVVHQSDGSIGLNVDNNGNGRFNGGLAVGNASGIGSGTLGEPIFDVEASTSGTFGSSGIVGINNVLNTTSTSSSGDFNVIGYFGNVLNNNSNPYTNGVYGQIVNAGQETTTELPLLRGGQFTVNTDAGTVDNSAAGEFRVTSNANATTTNAYGVLVDSANNFGGVLTNNYGLYINDQSSSGATGDNFNLYSDGTGLNYFGGNVGIGTTTPSEALSVAGNSLMTGQVAIGNVAAVNGGLLSEGLQPVILDIEESTTTTDGGTGIQNNEQFTPTTDGAAILGYLSEVGVSGTTNPSILYGGDILAYDSETSGTLGNLTGLVVSAINNNGGGLISSSTGLEVSANGADENIGLNIDNISGGSANYAIQTGTGLVSFGDSVGIGLGGFTPVNLLDVGGGAAIGHDYASVNTAPTNGLLVEGNVGIGTTSPGSALSVEGSGFFDGGTLTASDIVATSTLTIATSTAGCLQISASGRVYSTGSSCGSGPGGAAFPFTVNTNYNSTSTTLGFLNGFFSTASSTLSGNTFLPSLSQGFAYLGSNGLIQTVATSSLNLPTTALAALPINSIVTTNSSGNLIATGTQLTVGNLLATVTSATNQLLGNTVIGASSTPWAQFAINPVAGQASNAFVIGSSTATNFVVNNAGQVGIGTSSPYTALGVSGSGNTLISASKSTATDSGNAGNAALVYANNTVTSGIGFDADLIGLSGIASVGGGASGANTNSSNIVGVYGKANIGGTAGAGTNIVGVWGVGSGAGSLAARFDGTVYANGNLGVGSSTPGYPLSVEGSGFFDGGTLTASDIVATSTLTIATSTAGCLQISASGLVYAATCNGGSSFPFTVNTGYNSTSTTLGLLNGFFSTASSTLSGNTYLPSLSQGFAYLGSKGLIQTVATSSLNLPNAALQNSSLTINGSSVSLGGSITVSSTTLLTDNNTFSKLQTFAYSSTTNYSSFATASTTNLIVNGSSFNKLLGSGLTNSGGALTVSNVPFTSLAALAANSIVTTNASGNLIATGTQLTVGNILATTTTAVNQFLGNTVIGASSTPWAQFAINPVAGQASNAFVIGSSTATNFVVTNTGNVGIGNANPQNPLDVVLNQNGQSNISISNSTSGSTASAQFVMNGDSGNNATFGLTSSGYSNNQSITGAELYFYSNTTNGLDFIANNASAPIVFSPGGLAEKARFTSTGNFGIGTSSPYTTLGVNGSIVSTDLSGAANSVVYADANGKLLHTATGGAGTLCLVSASGAAPVWSSCSGSASTIWSSLTAPAGNLALSMGGNSTNFTWSNGNNFMWNSSGMVGIGTTTPAFQLDIATTTAPQISLNGANTDNPWTLRSIGSTFYLATSSPTTFATSSQAAFSITANGTTTVQALNILGGASGTTTSAVGFNITGGCYAINTKCIGGADTQFVSSNSGTSATTLTTSSSTVASVSITPALATGDVYVSGFVTVNSSQSATDHYLIVELEKTNCNAGGTILGTAIASTTSGSGVNGANMSLQGLDSNPGATSQTYALCARTSAQQDTASWSLSALVINSGADYAELYTTQDSNLHPGMIVAADRNNFEGVRLTTGKNDTGVLGIVSTQPGQVIGPLDASSTGSVVPIALSGRVPLMVSNENGPIAVGDNLTLSSTPGVAMKANPGDEVVAVALAADDFGATAQGTILAFVSRSASSNTGLYTSADFSATSTIPNGLSIVEGLSPINFTTTDLSTGSTTQEFGFDPSQVNGVDSHLTLRDYAGNIVGLNEQAFVPVLVNAIQTLDTNIQTIASTTASTTPASQSFAQSFFANLFTQITNWFATATNNIEKFYAKEVHTHQLCIADDSGNETCIDKSQLDQILANVGSSGSSNTSGSAATSTASSGTASAPVISINGANPASVNVGATYSDLGATVTGLDGKGEMSTNLDIYLTVDGVSMPSVNLDTSAAGEHAIVYSAQDSLGNWGYATRTVDVIAPAAASDNDATSTDASSTTVAVDTTSSGTASTTPGN